MMYAIMVCSLMAMTMTFGAAWCRAMNPGGE